MIKNAMMCVSVLVAMMALPASSADRTTDAPIEITADRLQVFKEQSRAIFTGKVEAVQKDIHIHSDKMIVFYVSNMERKKHQSQNAISKIEVYGNVVLTSDEETAKGDKGIYKVADGTLELTGDVLLTKDNNVVKGDYLFYNLNTGSSQVTSRGSAKNGNKTKNGRVRGVFVPGGN